MLPAYAGMIPGVSPSRMLPVGAPRVCGDDPDSGGEVLAIMSVLPAYAGMILVLPPNQITVCRAPRVCGDDPKSVI